MKAQKIYFNLKQDKKFFICLFFILVFLWSSWGLCSDTPVSNVRQAPNTITLDIKGMDILDVLKIISMKSNLNIIAGKNVTGKVTIYLKDVDLWDAFEIILVANNLAYERKGDIINVMTDRDYELIYGDKFYDKKELQIVKLKYTRVADASKALLQMKTNIGKVVTDEGSNTVILVDVPSRVNQMKEMIEKMDVPVETRVFSLKYAKAEDIEKKISELITKNVGVVRIDARTNRVVVTDLPDRMKDLENIIVAFDKKDAQVMIEAKIFEVTLEDNFKMGIDWDVVADKYFRLTQSLKLNLTTRGAIKVGTIAGGGDPQVKSEYSALIEALRTAGEVNTLSAPKIMALNNQESKILIGSKEPYSTKSTVSSEQTTTTAESVTFVDLGVQLYVTPTINEDGFVTMKIKPAVSSKSGTYTTADQNTIPIISTTEAETAIMVKDGATVIIAGLIKDTINKSTNKVPFLGDVPLLGNLFSNVSDLKKKEEIVVLLTPRIVSGESTFKEVERWQRQEVLSGKLKDRVEKEEEEIRSLQKNIHVQKQIEPPRELASVKEQESFDSQKLKMFLRIDVQNAAFKEAVSLDKSYSNYFMNIKRGIQAQIRRNFSDLQLKGEVTVSFVLDADGNIKGEPKVIKEDNKLLGDVLVESIKLASPFESFPKAFDAEEEKFTVTLYF